jgi:prepilin-type processing-associated H-X9-DG protein
MSTDARNTFSLRDLCVVVGVIVLLLAVLLPKLSLENSDSRRTYCENNIDQIALGMQKYVTSKGSFPGYRGNMAGTDGARTVQRDAPWFVAIGPYIEQAVINERWSSLDTSTYPYIEIATCPSDPPKRLTASSREPISYLSYVVNAGRPDTEADRSDEPSSANALPPDHAANGVFHDWTRRNAPRVGLEMKDGASNTLMLSENKQARYWSDRDEFRIAFVFHPVTEPRTTGEEAHYRINAGKGILDDDANISTARPSSNHPGGVMVTFCDGRTVFLRQDIEYKVYQQLMTPDGYHPECNVPATDDQGRPIVGSNKAYVLRSADYGTR